jgi:pimeloyl-ACP methyl ester carboxylesterase
MANSQQRYLEIDGITVRYQAGGQGPQVLLLHGWGGSIESFTPVYSDLMRSYTVYAFDFPGFGASSLPPTPWGSADYARLTLRMMDLLELVKPHMIAHSFGGQVAITLAATRPDRVGKLILVGSAGLRVGRRPAVRLKRSAARVGKWLAAHAGWIGEKLRNGIYRRVQSQDYANAGPLRATLVKVVNEDVRELLPRIQSPTLLVWGEQDRDVPLTAARLMARAIPDTQMVVLEHAGHFSYLDQFGRFRLIIGRFLRDDGETAEMPRI